MPPELSIGLWQSQAEKLNGIEPDAIPANTDVKVRPGDAARCSGKAEFRTFVEFVSFMHVDARHV
jgi:hypothetical protein